MKLGIEPAANGSATVYVGIFSEDLNTKTRRIIEVKTKTKTDDEVKIITSDQRNASRSKRGGMF